MANRCKPGDLAVVVSAQHQCNLGRIVKIIEQHNRTGPLVYDQSLSVWLVECPAPLKWTYNRQVYKRKRGPVPDASLQPIREQPLPKTKRQVEVLEAV